MTYSQYSKNIVLLFCIFLSYCVVGQEQGKIDWGANFIGKINNNEYIPLENPSFVSSTLIGTNNQLFGYWSERNIRIYMGINYQLLAGTPHNKVPPKLISYLFYQNKSVTLHVGFFPVQGILNYPSVLYARLKVFTRPLMEGLHVTFHKKNFEQKAWVDWIGAKSATQREEFLTGTYGFYKINNFFLQNYAILTHRASTDSISQLDESLGLLLLGGWIKTQNSWTVSIRSGLLATGYNDRKLYTSWETGAAFFAQINARYQNWGIATTLKLGSTAPLHYATSLFQGKNYLQLRPYWRLYTKEKYNITASYNLFNIDGKWGQRQTINIIYRLRK